MWGKSSLYLRGDVPKRAYEKIESAHKQGNQDGDPKVPHRGEHGVLIIDGNAQPYAQNRGHQGRHQHRTNNYSRRVQVKPKGSNHNGAAEEPGISPLHALVVTDCNDGAFAVKPGFKVKQGVEPFSGSLPEVRQGLADGSGRRIG